MTNILKPPLLDAITALTSPIISSRGDDDLISQFKKTNMDQPKKGRMNKILKVEESDSYLQPTNKNRLTDV